MSKLIKNCDDNSYFVLALADDMKFESVNWDIELLKYFVEPFRSFSQTVKEYHCV